MTEKGRPERIDEEIAKRPAEAALDTIATVMHATGCSLFGVLPPGTRAADWFVLVAVAELQAAGRLPAGADVITDRMERWTPDDVRHLGATANRLRSQLRPA